MLEEPLLVFEDLQSHELLGLMVECSQYDSERALAELLDDLVPVCDVLVHDNDVLLLLVVETVVIDVGPILQDAHPRGLLRLAASAL